MKPQPHYARDTVCAVPKEKPAAKREVKESWKKIQPLERIVRPPALLLSSSAIAARRARTAAPEPAFDACAMERVAATQRLRMPATAEIVPLTERGSHGLLDLLALFRVVASGSCGVDGRRSGTHWAGLASNGGGNRLRQLPPVIGLAVVRSVALVAVAATRFAAVQRVLARDGW